MNAPLQTCETWAEAISLLAAGCLTSEEEHELQQHLAGCDACRERFDQVAVVCEGLRVARPAGTGSDTDVVSRIMREIEDQPGSTGQQSAARSSQRLRWKLIVGSVVAASVLAFVAWRSFFDASSPEPNIAHDDPQIVVPVPVPEPVPSPQIEVAETAFDGSGPPTWLALQRAFAESDEAFDTLLVQHNEESPSSPLDIHSILEEL